MGRFSKHIVGEKYFEGAVSVTDPCYNESVWCRINNIQLKPGNYHCIKWTYLDPESCSKKTRKHLYVGACGIYLDGIIPVQKDMKEIGEIGVDAGLAGFFMNKPNYTDSEWTDFCNRIRKGDAWIFDEGFFTSSGYGDGGYPVYEARNKDGEIIALEIRFM